MIGMFVHKMIIYSMITLLMKKYQIVKDQLFDITIFLFINLNILVTYNIL